MTETIEQAEFSTDEACRLAGCSYRQLDYWLSTDRVRGVAGENPGSGHRRRISAHEVDVLTTALALADVGFVIDRAFAYGRRLVETGEPVVVGCVTIGAKS